jgi:hypothetical protein
LHINYQGTDNSICLEYLSESNTGKQLIPSNTNFIYFKNDKFPLPSHSVITNGRKNSMKVIKEGKEQSMG